jgi:hypothetical protein
MWFIKAGVILALRRGKKAQQDLQAANPSAIWLPQVSFLPFRREMLLLSRRSLL